MIPGQIPARNAGRGGPGPGPGRIPSQNTRAGVPSQDTGAGPGAEGSPGTESGRVPGQDTGVGSQDRTRGRRAGSRDRTGANPEPGHRGGVQGEDRDGSQDRTQDNGGPGPGHRPQTGEGKGERAGTGCVFWLRVRRWTRQARLGPTAPPWAPPASLGALPVSRASTCQEEQAPKEGRGARDGPCQSLKCKNWSQNWTKSVPKSLDGVWKQQFLLQTSSTWNKSFPKASRDHPFIEGQKSQV